jgi:phage terminase Nu1 subunit (DNA packaging protein)
MTIVNSARLGELFGVAAVSIEKFATRQLVVKVGPNKYDLERSIQVHMRHLRAQAAGRPEKSAAREKLLGAQTKLVDLKRQQAEGSLVSFEKTMMPLLQKIFSAHQEIFFAVPDIIWRQFKFDTPTMTIIDGIIDKARTDAANLVKETPVEFLANGKRVIGPAVPADYVPDVDQIGLEDLSPTPDHTSP